MVLPLLARAGIAAGGIAGRFLIKRAAKRGIRRVAKRSSRKVFKRFVRGVGGSVKKGGRKIRAFTRKPKIRRIIKPRTIRGKIVRGAALTGAGFAAEAGIRRLVNRRRDRRSSRGKVGSRAAMSVGAPVLQSIGTPRVVDRALTTQAGGRTMGLLSRAGPVGRAAAAVAGGGALLFGAEQLAEFAGVRGGAGFIGRRPRRRSRRRNIVSKRAMKNIRRVKGYKKQLRKAASALGMKLVKTGTATGTKRKVCK